MNLTFSQPIQKDIEPLIDIFYESFPKNYKLSKTVIKDVLELYIPAAGKHFLVAKNPKNEIAAFICGVKDMRKPLTQALKTLPKSLTFLTKPHSRFIIPPLFVQLFSGAHLVFGSTHSKYRKQGVFTEVMQKSISQLKKDNVKKIWFETLDGNQAIKRLAEKFGFKLIKQFPYENQTWSIYLLRL